VKRLFALALAAGGCGLIESPEAAIAATSAELEAKLPRQGQLELTRLRFEPPRLAYGDHGEVLVNALLWAEGTLAGKKVVFHGGETLVMTRSMWGGWALRQELPRLAAVADALAARRPPAPVAQWAVGLSDASSGEVREEYQRDAAGRPVRAAARLAIQRSAEGRWTVTDR
jgi:hypothetical protein